MNAQQHRDTADAMDAWGKPGVEIEYLATSMGWIPERGVPLNWGHSPRRIKPQPKTRDWSFPADVPANCWISVGSGLNNNMVEGLVLEVTSRGVYTLIHGEITFHKWVDLMGRTYSTDRKTWLPCAVTE